MKTATRDLVHIGQRWQPKSRKRTKPAPIVIYQIHRADRTVDAWVDNGGRTMLVGVNFRDLRTKYDLLPTTEEE